MTVQAALDGRQSPCASEESDTLARLSYVPKLAPCRSVLAGDAPWFLASPGASSDEIVPTAMCFVPAEVRKMD